MRVRSGQVVMDKVFPRDTTDKHKHNPAAHILQATGSLNRYRRIIYRPIHPPVHDAQRVQMFQSQDNFSTVKLDTGFR